MHRLILLMNCPDKKGIIAHITNFIHDKKGNIVYIDQYVDRLNETFYMRVEIEADISNNYFNDFRKEFDKTLGYKFKLNCEFYLKEEKPKMAVFVSKYDHCLYDILAQQYYGDPSLWWVIASANPQLPKNSYYPPEGSQLRIPANYGSSIRAFEAIN